MLLRNTSVSAHTRTLWLVRHGDTIWSETGGIAGRSDIDLSEVGQARVKSLADTMTESALHSQWFASPLKRTRETTSLLRGAVSEVQGSGSPTGGNDDADHRFVSEVSFDGRLVELDFGDWEGSTWDKAHEQQGDALAAWGRNWVSTAPPNGESFLQQYARCAAWLNDWESDSAVVVTHGGCIRALLCRLLNLPLEEAMRWSVDLACIYRFTWSETDPQWRLRSANQQSF